MLKSFQFVLDSCIFRLLILPKIYQTKKFNFEIHVRPKEGIRRIRKKLEHTEILIPVQSIFKKKCQLTQI